MTEDAAGPKRTKGIYIGAPACFALEEAVRHICEAFRVYDDPRASVEGVDAYMQWGGGCYIVGSCLERADWRDVDVRLMLGDKKFAEIFPDAGDNWEHDARWLLLTCAISERLSRQTGLPVDFQIQPTSHANKHHKGHRSAVGLRFGSGGKR